MISSRGVFDIGLYLEMDPVTHESVRHGHSVRNTYVAVLEGPELFGRRVRAEAVRSQFPYADESIAIGDGAGWIWNSTEEQFGTSRQVVDRYQAKEYLYLVAHQLFGYESAEAQRSVNGTETPLYHGQAARITELVPTLD